jgi:hypothetical protein
MGVSNPIGNRLFCPLSAETELQSANILLSDDPRIVDAVQPRELDRAGRHQPVANRLSRSSSTR